MKLLQTTTLAAILMKCIAASTLGMIQVRDAIEERDFATIKELFKGNLLLCYETINCVIDTEDRGLIVDFIKHAELANRYTFAALYQKGLTEVIQQSFKEFDLSKGTTSVSPASPQELVCSPGKFIGLIKGITTLRGQAAAVVDGVRGMFFYKRTDCIDPLLDVLEGHGSLKDVAIEMVFVEGASRHNETWMRGFYNHPAITPAIYVNATFSYPRSDVRNPILRWLLATAGQDDLQKMQVTIKSRGLKDRYPDFVHAVEQTISSAKPGKSRSSPIGQRAKTTIEAVSDLVPQVLAIIIGCFVTEELMLWEKVKMAKEAITEITNDPLSEEIGNIIGSYLGEDD